MLPTTWKTLTMSKDGRSNQIIIVSGLPRSGTSMMMKILEAGGLETLTDNIRPADEDNPRGYYEFEQVKALQSGEQKWINQARGKVVKVISALLEYLPSDCHYKVVFMSRNMEEILASQRQMLIRRGESPNKVSDEVIAEYFRGHLRKVESWLSTQPNMEMLYINYNEVLKDPKPNLETLNRFLGGSLNLRAMLQVVDPNLYRQRQD